MALLRTRGGGLLATGPDAIRANAMRQQQSLLQAARAPNVMRAPTTVIQEKNPINQFGAGMQKLGDSLRDRAQQKLKNEREAQQLATQNLLAQSLANYRLGQLALGGRAADTADEQNRLRARQQDFTYSLGRLRDETARRGQDQIFDLGQARNLTTRRGQNLNYDLGLLGDDTRRRGQDKSFELGMTRDDTTRRGQDLTFELGDRLERGRNRRFDVAETGKNVRAAADRNLRERAFGLRERQYDDKVELQKRIENFRKQAADAFADGKTKEAQALALRADTTASTLQALMQGKTTAAGISPKDAPKLPRGMEYVLNPQGKVVLEADDKGGFTFKKRKIAPDSKALNDARNKAIEQYNLASRAIDFITQNPKAATGLFGAYFGTVPGTPGFNLDQTLETLRAALSFETLDLMRQNSPTGGALGQVSNYEVSLLQKERTNLAIGQTPEVLIANLRRLQRLRMLIISPMDEDSVLVDLFDKNDVVNNPKAPGEKLTFQQWFYDNRMRRPEYVTDEQLLEDWNKLKGGGSGGSQ